MIFTQKSLHKSKFEVTSAYCERYVTGVSCFSSGFCISFNKLSYFAKIQSVPISVHICSLELLILPLKPLIIPNSAYTIDFPNLTSHLSLSSNSLHSNLPPKPQFQSSTVAYRSSKPSYLQTEHTTLPEWQTSFPISPVLNLSHSKTQGFHMQRRRYLPI